MWPLSTGWYEQMWEWYLSKGYKHSDLKGHLHPNVYSSNAHNSQTRKEPRCPLTDEWIKKMWHMCVCVYTHTHTHTHTHTLEYYAAIKK